MKAITIHQPWATKIIKRHKRFETRSWYTAHRGLLAIHAGRTTAHVAFPDMWPLGAVLGTVNLVGCHLMTQQFIDQQTPEELALGNWALGRYAWELEGPLEFEEPVPCKGQQGLWQWGGRQL